MKSSKSKKSNKSISSILNKMLNVFSYKELPKTFIIFYSVGLLLYALPLTRPIFLFLTPYSLLMVFGAIIYHHKNKKLKFYIYSLLVISFSFFIEAAGIETGAIFGNYQYLNSLGIKILGTPLIIGINWLMLTYCSAAIIEYIQNKSSNKISVALKSIGGATLMLSYDFVAELVAPSMKMWEFSGSRPPMENYIMWFLLAFLFHILLYIYKIKPSGKPARVLFIAQILFFVFIYIYNLIFL